MEDGDIATDWGPINWYEHEHREPNPSFLEIYIRLNSEDLEAKPFRMFVLEEGSGIGVSCGYEFEKGIPMIFKIRLGNEWQGL